MEFEVETMEMLDYSSFLDSIILNQEQIIELLEKIEKATIQLNGYFYLLIFILLGVGGIYLFYRFLKIFM